MSGYTNVWILLPSVGRSPREFECCVQLCSRGFRERRERTATLRYKSQYISAVSLFGFFFHPLSDGTRYTIEVAHFRYFFSERRGFLTPHRRDVNLDFEKKRFVDLGHGIIRRDAF